MTEPANTSRREFLVRSAAVAGAALAAGLPGCASGDRRRPQTPKLKGKPVLAAPPPDGVLRVAFVGTGGIGGYHLDEISRIHTDETNRLSIVCPCYCDVDTARMQKAAELHPDARPYQDYRAMYEEEKDHFDAVMIGAPDHHHYPATILAMRLGKHVYTQKPLVHTVWEARQLSEAAKKYQVATQMGNQGHANEGWRRVYEWVHSGAIGDVVETHTWTDRPIWPQGMERPEETDPVPDSLDWDCWLGPAPERPYKSRTYHPFAWRGFWDFGTGALGDMACHTMDSIFSTLDPGAPTSVEPVGATPLSSDAYPVASIIRFEFPARHGRRAFTAYWYDGRLKPAAPQALELERDLPNTGNLFIGTKASLLIGGDYVDSPRIIPEKKMREVGAPPRMLERSPGHVDEWVMAASGQKPIDYPGSNFLYSGPLTEAILLGNVALRAGRRIEWDSRDFRVTNVPKANDYLTKQYRLGWQV